MWRGRYNRLRCATGHEAIPTITPAVDGLTVDPLKDRIDGRKTGLLECLQAFWGQPGRRVAEVLRGLSNSQPARLQFRAATAFRHETQCLWIREGQEGSDLGSVSYKAGAGVSKATPLVIAEIVKFLDERAVRCNCGLTTVS